MARPSEGSIDTTVDQRGNLRKSLEYAFPIFSTYDAYAEAEKMVKDKDDRALQAAIGYIADNPEYRRRFDHAHEQVYRTRCVAEELTTMLKAGSAQGRHLRRLWLLGGIADTIDRWVTSPVGAIAETLSAAFGGAFGANTIEETLEFLLFKVPFLLELRKDQYNSHKTKFLFAVETASSYLPVPLLGDITDMTLNLYMWTATETISMHGREYLLDRKYSKTINLPPEAVKSSPKA